MSAERCLLHVGCGPASPPRLPSHFTTPDWREIRLDIDPAVGPDILASITALTGVDDASVDAVYSSHNLEHLNAFEVPLALAEFMRVLKPSGYALITLPDLRAVARHILNDQLEQVLYQSAAGPISALDVLFGHQAALQRGHHFMAHRTGFTARSLGQHLIAAGFSEVRVHEGSNWDLWAIATMGQTAPDIFDQLADVTA